MKMNQYIVNTTCPPGNASMISGHCSGAILARIRGATLPAAMLAVAVVLATGCSATGSGFKARLISPVSINEQATNSDDNWYQPSRSPGFDPDLFGS
jgi:hypothetical protein